jgi:hypothetical protein
MVRNACRKETRFDSNFLIINVSTVKSRMRLKREVTEKQGSYLHYGAITSALNRDIIYTLTGKGIVI